MDIPLPDDMPGVTEEKSKPSSPSVKLPTDIGTSNSSESPDSPKPVDNDITCDERSSSPEDLLQDGTSNKTVVDDDVQQFTACEESDVGPSVPTAEATTTPNESSEIKEDNSSVRNDCSPFVYDISIMDIPIPESSSQYSPSVPNEDEIVETTHDVLDISLPEGPGVGSILPAKSVVKKRLISMLKQTAATKNKMENKAKEKPSTSDSKKKKKKIPAPLVQARSTIDEIEELKRRENEVRENIHILECIKKRESAKQKAQEDAINEFFEARERNEERERRDRKRQRDREKEREREKERKQSKLKNWKQFNKEGFVAFHFRRVKSKWDNLDKPKKYRDKDRFNLFETPKRLRDVIVVRSRDEKDLDFPSWCLKTTKTRPVIKYCLNPLYDNSHVLSKQQILDSLPEDILANVKSFWSSIKSKRIACSEKGQVSRTNRPKKKREWYAKVFLDETLTPMHLPHEDEEFIEEEDMISVDIEGRWKDDSAVDTKSPMTHTGDKSPVLFSKDLIAVDIEGRWKEDDTCVMKKESQYYSPANNNEAVVVDIAGKWNDSPQKVSGSPSKWERTPGNESDLSKDLNIHPPDESVPLVKRSRKSSISSNQSIPSNSTSLNAKPVNDITPVSKSNEVCVDLYDINLPPNNIQSEITKHEVNTIKEEKPKEETVILEDHFKDNDTPIKSFEKESRRKHENRKDFKEEVPNTHHMISLSENVTGITDVSLSASNSLHLKSDRNDNSVEDKNSSAAKESLVTEYEEFMKMVQLQDKAKESPDIDFLENQRTNILEEIQKSDTPKSVCKEDDDNWSKTSSMDQHSEPSREEFENATHKKDSGGNKKKRNKGITVDAKIKRKKRKRSDSESSVSSTSSSSSSSSSSSESSSSSSSSSSSVSSSSDSSSDSSSSSSSSSVSSSSNSDDSSKVNKRTKKKRGSLKKSKKKNNSKKKSKRDIKKKGLKSSKKNKRIISKKLSNEKDKAKWKGKDSFKKKKTGESKKKEKAEDKKKKKKKKEKLINSPEELIKQLGKKKIKKKSKEAKYKKVKTDEKSVKRSLKYDKKLKKQGKKKKSEDKFSLKKLTDNKLAELDKKLQLLSDNNKSMDTFEIPLSKDCVSKDSTSDSNKEPSRTAVTLNICNVDELELSSEISAKYDSVKNELKTSITKDKTNSSVEGRQGCDTDLIISNEVEESTHKVQLIPDSLEKSEKSVRSDKVNLTEMDEIYEPSYSPACRSNENDTDEQWENPSTIEVPSQSFDKFNLSDSKVEEQQKGKEQVEQNTSELLSNDLQHNSSNYPIKTSSHLNTEKHFDELMKQTFLMEGTSQDNSKGSEAYVPANSERYSPGMSDDEDEDNDHISVSKTSYSSPKDIQKSPWSENGNSITFTFPKHNQDEDSKASMISLENIPLPSTESSCIELQKDSPIPSLASESEVKDSNSSSTELSIKKSTVAFSPEKDSNAQHASPHSFITMKLPVARLTFEKQVTKIKHSNIFSDEDSDSEKDNKPGFKLESLEVKNVSDNLVNSKSLSDKNVISPTVDASVPLACSKSGGILADKSLQAGVMKPSSGESHVNTDSTSQILDSTVDKSEKELSCSRCNEHTMNTAQTENAVKDKLEFDLFDLIPTTSSRSIIDMPSHDSAAALNKHLEKEGCTKLSSAQSSIKHPLFEDVSNSPLKSLPTEKHDQSPFRNVSPGFGRTPSPSRKYSSRSSATKSPPRKSSNSRSRRSPRRSPYSRSKRRKSPSKRSPYKDEAPRGSKRSPMRDTVNRSYSKHSPTRDRYQRSPGRDRYRKSDSKERHCSASASKDRYRVSPSKEIYRKSPAKERYRKSPARDRYPPGKEKSRSSPYKEKYHSSPGRDRYQISPSRDRYRKSSSKERYRSPPNKESFRKSPVKDSYHKSPVKDRYNKSPSKERFSKSLSRDRTPPKSSPPIREKNLDILPRSPPRELNKPRPKRWDKSPNYYSSDKRFSQSRSPECIVKPGFAQEHLHSKLETVVESPVKLDRSEVTKSNLQSSNNNKTSWNTPNKPSSARSSYSLSAVESTSNNNLINITPHKISETGLADSTSHSESNDGIASSDEKRMSLDDRIRLELGVDVLSDTCQPDYNYDQQQAYNYYQHSNTAENIRGVSSSNLISLTDWHSSPHSKPAMEVANNSTSAPPLPNDTMKAPTQKKTEGPIVLPGSSAKLPTTSSSVVQPRTDVSSQPLSTLGKCPTGSIRTGESEKLSKVAPVKLPPTKHTQPSIPNVVSYAPKADQLSSTISSQPSLDPLIKMFFSNLQPASKALPLPAISEEDLELGSPPMSPSPAYSPTIASIPITLKKYVKDKSEAMLKRKEEKEKRKKERELRHLKKQQKLDKKLQRQRALLKEGFIKSSEIEEDDQEPSSSYLQDPSYLDLKIKVLTSDLYPPPGKSILCFSGFGLDIGKNNEGKKKTVSFADGIKPGEGSSPAVNDEHKQSPPPNKSNSSKKKRKVKVRIVRMGDEEGWSPPPPPPGTPPPEAYHTYCTPDGFVYSSIVPVTTQVATSS